MAKSLCGILITDDELRSLTLKPTRKGFRLAGFGLHLLSMEERLAPGSALRTMLKRTKSLPDQAFFCLPKEQATLHNVLLPAKEPDEIKTMAQFEAERHIPFNAERHYVGHQVLADRGAEGTETLLAAVDGPVIDRVIKATQDAGIRPKGMNISSACLVNAMMYTMPERARTKTVMLVSIGLQSLDLVFTHQGRIVFSRSVPHGLRSLIRDWNPTGPQRGADLDPVKIGMAARMIDLMDMGDKPTPGEAKPADGARAWLMRLIQELQRSYDFARREMSCPEIESVVVAGEGAILRNLEQYLYVNLNVEVVTLNPVAQLARGKLKNLPFDGLELTVPFGAAIQSTLEHGYTLDLTPHAYYRQVEKRKLIRSCITSGILAMIVCGLGYTSLKTRQEINLQLFEDYKEANQKMRGRVKQLQDEKQKLLILESFLEDPTSALAVLNHIFTYPDIPDGVTITEIDYDKGDQAIIEGHAREIPDFGKFVDDLTRAGLFSEVVRVSRDLRSVGRNLPKVYVFRLKCTIPKREPSTESKLINEMMAKIEAAAISQRGQTERAL